MQQPSSPSSSASSTDLQHFRGTLTLGELVQEIEAIVGERVESLLTGCRRKFHVYWAKANPPIVDLNLVVDEAVAQREAHSVEVAEARTAANRALGRRRVKAERRGEKIYFSVACINCEAYYVSWSR